MPSTYVLRSLDCYVLPADAASNVRDSAASDVVSMANLFVCLGHRWKLAHDVFVRKHHLDLNDLSFVQLGDASSVTKVRCSIGTTSRRLGLG